MARLSIACAALLLAAFAFAAPADESLSTYPGHFRLAGTISPTTTTRS